jgi:hypothetical protein
MEQDYIQCWCRLLSFEVEEMKAATKDFDIWAQVD